MDYEVQPAMILEGCFLGSTSGDEPVLVVWSSARGIEDAVDTVELRRYTYPTASFISLSMEELDLLVEFVNQHREKTRPTIDLTGGRKYER